MLTNNPTAMLEVLEDRVKVLVDDPREQVRGTFDGLTPAHQSQLAIDAWTIGLRAMANAHAQAQEARLADVGKTLLDDLDTQLTTFLKSHEDSLLGALKRYFDPTDGQVAERLRSFVDDEGNLARMLQRYVGPTNSVLAETLARQVGEQSLLFKRLSPTDGDGLIKALEVRIVDALARSNHDVQRALDPLAEDGAVARFLRQLNADLASSNKGNAAQLATALAALDANDEQSLIRKLVRETTEARESLLRALNPIDPNSPIAAIRIAIKEALDKQSLDHETFRHEQRERQERLELELRDALTRLETRRDEQARSPRGGLTFETAVTDFITALLRGAPISVEETGAKVGARRGCKVGDLVLTYGAEHVFSGGAVVVEAKHDASYTEHTALGELDVARANRSAQVGLFVMAASHAPPSFPRLKRCGQNVLVRWDETDSRSDPWLEAAVTIALFLVSRTRAAGSAGDITAMRDIEERIETELKRLDRMEESTQTIRRNCDTLDAELGKAKRQFNLLLRNAKETLSALNVEIVEEDKERACPLVLPSEASVQ